MQLRWMLRCLVVLHNDNKRLKSWIFYLHTCEDCKCPDCSTNLALVYFNMLTPNPQLLKMVLCAAEQQCDVFFILCMLQPYQNLAHNSTQPPTVYIHSYPFSWYSVIDDGVRLPCTLYCSQWVNLHVRPSDDWWRNASRKWKNTLQIVGYGLIYHPQAGPTEFRCTYTVNSSANRSLPTQNWGKE